MIQSQCLCRQLLILHFYAPLYVAIMCVLLALLQRIPSTALYAPSPSSLVCCIFALKTDLVGKLDTFWNVIRVQDHHHPFITLLSINRSIIQSSCGAGKESIKKRCLHDMQNNCGWWWSWNILFYTTDMHWDFSSLGYILRMQWTALYCLLQHFNDYKWPIDRQSMWEGGRERETHTKEQPIFIFTTNNNNIPIRRMFIGRINGTATTAQHPRDSYL